MLVSAGGNVGSAASTRAVLTVAVAAELVMPALIPLYSGAARAPAHQRRGLLEAARDSGLSDEPDLEAGLLPRTSEGVTSDLEAHHGANGWLYCASIEPETAEEQAAWRKARPAATPSRQSAGRGPLRGRSGRWPPSRPDPAGGSSSCGTRWTAGRSARRTEPDGLPRPSRLRGRPGPAAGGSLVGPGGWPPYDECVLPQEFCRGNTAILAPQPL